jgi:hypothetical protein
LTVDIDSLNNVTISEIDLLAQLVALRIGATMARLESVLLGRAIDDILPSDTNESNN